MVQRSGDEVRALSVETEDRPGSTERGHLRREVGLPPSPHSLRTTSGAGRVEHVAAGDRRRIQGRRRKARQHVVELPARFDDADRLRRLSNQIHELGVGKDHRRAGVGEHVGDLLASGMPVHGGEPQPRGQSRQHQLDELETVAHDHRDVVAGLQAQLIEQRAQTRHPIVELRPPTRAREVVHGEGLGIDREQLGQASKDEQAPGRDATAGGLRLTRCAFRPSLSCWASGSWD